MMNINNIIPIKSYYRFVEFVSLLVGNGLNHERYKLISLDLIEAESKEEQFAKHLADSYLYILSNIKQSLSPHILNKCYYLLNETLLTENIINKILSCYYRHINEDIIVQTIYLQKTILKTDIEQRIPLSFILSNYLLLKNDHQPLIPYRHTFDQYLANININDDETWLELITSMIEKEHCNNYSQIDKDEFISLIKGELPNIKNKYHISFLALYGGIVKGILTSSSDVDLLIQYDEQLLDFERSQNTLLLKQYLKDITHLDIDIIDFSHALHHLDINEMNNIVVLIK